MSKYKSSDDGKLIDQRMVIFLKPRYRPASGEDADAAAHRAPGDDRHGAHALSNARWDKGDYDHGEEARLSADARSAEGRHVEFVVERCDDGQRWTEVGRATAPVVHGTASVTVRLQHPKGADPAAAGGHRHVRFHAGLQ